MVLPASDVLSRAVSASSQLTSAAFQGTVHVVKEKAWNADASLEGHVSNGGQQSDIHVSAAMQMLTSSQNAHVQMAGRAIVDGPVRYVQLQSIESTPAMEPFSQLSPVQGIWWKISAPIGATDSLMSPDPSLLRAQAAIIRVVRDEGFVHIRGHRTYHYGVDIDRKKLEDFLSLQSANARHDVDSILRTFDQYIVNGEVWIDAETFVLRRVLWDVRKKDDQLMQIVFDISVTDHNASISIVPPSTYTELSNIPFTTLLNKQPSFLPQR